MNPMAFLNACWRWMATSILVRLGLAMGTLACLSFGSILISTLIAESSSGKAYAINLSGSMRMMSYRLLSEGLMPELRAQLPDSQRLYESRLSHLGRVLDKRLADHPLVLRQYGDIVSRWRSSIQPAVMAAGTGDQEALRVLSREVPDLVERIDALVLGIEEDLERQIVFLRATQYALLAVIIALSVLTTWMLRGLLVRPLAELLKAANEVGRGSFATRVRHTGEDELGRLGAAFNTMLDEIAGMYAGLEDKVTAKTAELTRINQSLELLYRTSQRLSASDLTLEGIESTLREVERALDLGHSMLCLGEQGQVKAHPVLSNLSSEEKAALCKHRPCSDCFAASPSPMLAEGKAVSLIRLGDAESRLGVMPVLASDAQPLSPETLRILETVGHHIANALANMRQAEARHRIAVLEERAVIARELHDSIAQSLSYLKIQVTRLQPFLAGQPQAIEIAEEIRQGLSSAYRELRELITTFRLRVDERGLTLALPETVAEFSHKMGIEIALDNRLADILLSGNEELHVLRIIREALANIEKHAAASQVGLRLSVDGDGLVSVEITDDGRGFNPDQIPANHYGLAIMRDRAHSLDGLLEIESRPGLGTRVKLRFSAEKYRPHPVSKGEDDV